MLENFPRRVVGKPRLALGRWAWLAAGLVLIGCAAVFRQSELAWLAAFPLALAFFLWAFREQRFELQFSEGTLCINEGQPIALESVTRVKGLGVASMGAASFPIFVRHTAGQFVIPARLDVPSSDVLAHLKAHAAAHVLQLDSRLDEYLRKQEELFGNQVAIFVGETTVSVTQYWGLVKAILASSLVCGVLGFGAYASGWGNDGALILGVIAAPIFLVTGLMALVANSRSPKGQHVETAGLIVSPGGLAMIQGELIGELRWEEIRSAKLSKGTVTLSRNNQFRGECVHLSVEGATIVIADIYHEPISAIYASILRLKSV